MEYAINEVFQTIQGEGWHTGIPAIFVRLQGCDVGCAWCDTQQTWEVSPDKEVNPSDIMRVDGTEGRWALLSVDALIAEMKLKNWTAKWVVITGGEPCMHDLRPLCLALEEAGYQVQIETSGTYPVQASAQTWVTVSPKVAMKGRKEVLQEALERADEIKHPVSTSRHIEQLDALLEPLADQNKRICLQPISQKAHATSLAMQVCIERNWRLSVQMHKYLAID